MQLNLSTLENEQIIFYPHYKYHQLQKRLNVPLSMLAVRLDNQRRAGKHAHLPPIEEQTRENSKKSSLPFKEDPISSPWNSRSFDIQVYAKICFHFSFGRSV